jgi:hypothetical protein
VQISISKTIPIVLLVVASFNWSCRQVPKNVQAETSEQSNSHAKIYGPPKIVGRFKNVSLTESSGLAASRLNQGIYWTHNDSGGGPFIYAIDERGTSFGVWRVQGAKNDDWEDVGVGPGPDASKFYLYIGDIGDNGSSRREVSIYRIPEPVASASTSASTKAKPELTEVAEVITLRYPDGKHDAETLIIHPTTGVIYIVTKVAMSNPKVYRAEPPSVVGQTVTMKFIGELKIPSLFGGILTGGSISFDGKRVAFCDYFQGFEVVLPDGASDFDEIWKQKLLSFDFGKRKQGEGVAYRADGRALLGTSEGKNAPLIQVER